MAVNLTGVPSAAAGDLGLVSQNQEQLSEEELLARKKKLMGAAMSGPMLSATQYLTGSGTAFSSQTVRSALGMAY